uniref:Uncharacterized protein n=1 Tax=Rhizophora mucronata TaxID=61149 RepID=A0A2P2LLV0_RHIMU
MEKQKQVYNGEGLIAQMLFCRGSGGEGRVLFNPSNAISYNQFNAQNY